jgi:hypothetical protein
LGTPILYQFHVTGYIPGYPYVFPSGTWARFDPDTNELLETGTLAGEQSVEPPVDVPNDSVPQDNLLQGE